MSEVVALGTVNLGGATFAVDREGDIAAGKASTFGVELVSAKAAVPKDAWLQGADGKKVCIAVLREPEGVGFMREGLR